MPLYSRASSGKSVFQVTVTSSPMLQWSRVQLDTASIVEVQDIRPSCFCIRLSDLRCNSDEVDASVHLRGHALGRGYGAESEQASEERSGDHGLSVRLVKEWMRERLKTEGKVAGGWYRKKL